MVSIMHSGGVCFQSFAVGIWQSQPLQHHIPRLNVYNEHVKWV